MDYSDKIKVNLNNCLTQTDFVGGSKKIGKVRDRYELANKMVLISTDRQSAFDKILASVPFKGQVLNQTSAWWFKKTNHIIANHLIDTPDPNAMVVKKCQVFPVEMVVRGFLTGSTDTAIWTHYQKGVRNYCSNILPEGMKKNQKFYTPIITPTTKSDEHDQPISPEQIVHQGLMSQQEWNYISQKALELFRFGQATALQHGLILVDTKYEFGKDENGRILLIDELHTPDSSRYWLADSYEERLANGVEPANIDKEFLRLWFKEHCDPYHDLVLPTAPDELVIELANRYIQLYETITGERFIFPDLNENTSVRIANNLSDYLKIDTDNITFTKTIPVNKNTADNLSTKPLVGVIMGSASDLSVVQSALDTLDQLEIPYEKQVVSAHRTPDLMFEYAKTAHNRGLEVIIACAGGAAHLPGMTAAITHLPVIGIPRKLGSLEGLDSLLSIVQMPKGVPVATVAIDGAKNAALLAARILGIKYPDIAQKIINLKEHAAQEIKNTII